ncbi:MAG: universal stress protein [bacterium]
MKAIVPLDGSDNSRRIFSTVKRLLALQPAIEIHLVSVHDPKSVHGSQDHLISEPPSAAVGRTAVSAPLPRVVESHGEALDREALETKSLLTEIANSEIPGAAMVAHVVWSSHPAKAITDLGDELDADLIVMATHGRSGVAHLLAGSVTEAVIRSASRPVLVQGPAAS